MSTNHEPRVRLTAWAEIIGTVRGLLVEGEIVYVEIGGKCLELPNESWISTYIQEMVGKTIAILRTDMPEEPFLIRLVGPENVHRNSRWLRGEKWKSLGGRLAGNRRSCERADFPNAIRGLGCV